MSRDKYISDEAMDKLKSDLQQIKYCAAKMVWKIRADNCPVPQRIDKFKKTVTWSEWFKIKFGEDLNDYAARIKRDGRPCKNSELADRQATA